MEQTVFKNLPVSYQEEMARQVAALSGRLSAPTGNKIRISQNKVFTFPDGRTTDDKFQAVVVDFICRNDYYSTGFDPADIQPPDCFAIGQKREDCIPSRNVPHKEHPTCKGCPQAEWGSGARGKGKACKESTLLAVLPPDAASDHPLWLLQVSPTGVKYWDNYVRDVVRAFAMMPVGVITTIGFDPNETYPSLRFGHATPYEGVERFMARQSEATDILAVEPDVSGTSEKAVKAPAPKRATARK